MVNLPVKDLSETRAGRGLISLHKREREDNKS